MGKDDPPAPLVKGRTLARLIRNARLQLIDAEYGNSSIASRDTHATGVGIELRSLEVHRLARFDDHEGWDDPAVLPGQCRVDELSPSSCPADFQLTSDAELNCRILANAGNADVLAYNPNEPPARPSRRGGLWSTAILRSSPSCLFLRVGNVLGGVIREVDHRLRSIDFKT
jgi:hypothetical protein